jgi:hypothetical protein
MAYFFYPYASVGEVQGRIKKSKKVEKYIIKELIKETSDRHCEDCRSDAAKGEADQDRGNPGK